jgi:hypothetical protein
MALPGRETGLPDRELALRGLFPGREFTALDDSFPELSRGTAAIHDFSEEIGDIVPLFRDL